MESGDRTGGEGPGAPAARIYGWGVGHSPEIRKRRRVEVSGSHPSTKNVEGWGTQIFGNGQDFKNLGCATRLHSFPQVPKGEAPGPPVSNLGFSSAP
jgi:hypothetical protein